MAKNTDFDDKVLTNSSGQEAGKASGTNSLVDDSENSHKEQKSEKIPAGTPHVLNSSGKNIRRYFFDFLMLFLAVFCGFLAENWREQLQENKREKEFIYSLVEDLKSDTLQSALILAQLKTTSAGIETVLKALSSPEILENSNEAYDLWTENLDIGTFVANDRTIQQLKNSGELRLITNKAVSDGIMKYDQSVKNYYQQSNFMYAALSDQRIYSQLFNFIDLNKKGNIPVPLTDKGKQSLNEAYAHLQLWNSGLLGLISWLEGVNNEGKLLVAFIQKEYGLKA
jgi:hypothetical protein